MQRTSKYERAILDMAPPSADSRVGPSGLGPGENETDERCEINDIDPNNHSVDLCYCNVCECTFCSNCWGRQVSHRKQRLAPGAIPHEKTDPWVAKQVQNVLTPNSDDFASQQLYLEDEETAWFGESDNYAEVSLLIYSCV
jgi:hypothetical protein